MNYASPTPIASLTESDLRLMRIFRVVASSGGLSAAEFSLHMDRSTISRHIKALELRLGGCLCLRGPAGFELTELGETVLAAAIAACDTLDAVRDDLNQARNILTGELIVGIADNCLSNPACRVDEALAMLGAEAPAVRLQVVVRPPADLVRELHARHLHLSINGAAPQDQDSVRHELFDEEFRLYVRGGGKVPRIDDLAPLGYSVVTRFADPHSAGLLAALRLEHAAVASGLEAAAILVAGGRHVGYLPDHYAATLHSRIDLVEVEGAVPLRYGIKFHLRYERSRPLTAAGRRFRDIVRQRHAVAA